MPGTVLAEPEFCPKKGAAMGMPLSQKRKCHTIVHGTSGVAAAAGLIPLPFADAVPITAAQVGMVVSLGAVFGVKLSNTVAKSVALGSAAMVAGRHIAANGAKFFPVIGSIIGAATAAGMTEAMGWHVASNFYRLSIGEDPDWVDELLVTLLKAQFGFNGGAGAAAR